MILKLIPQNPYGESHNVQRVTLLVGNTNKKGVEWYSNIVMLDSKIKRIKNYLSSTPFCGFKMKNSSPWIVGSRSK